jgi:hypothetical protein
MSSNIDYARLVPVEKMTGEDEEETAQLKLSLDEARVYLMNFSWCQSIQRELFGLGVGGVVAVFLFQIVCDTGTEVDDTLWVVCGDLPTAYLVPDNAPTPTAALDVYCGLMDEWIITVRKKGDLGNVFPVAAKPTEVNAAQLEKRVAFLRSEVIPAFE